MVVNAYSPTADATQYTINNAAHRIDEARRCKTEEGTVRPQQRNEPTSAQGPYTHRSHKIWIRASMYACMVCIVNKHAATLRARAHGNAQTPAAENYTL